MKSQCTHFCKIIILLFFMKLAIFFHIHIIYNIDVECNKPQVKSLKFALNDPKITRQSKIPARKL